MGLVKGEMPIHRMTQLVPLTVRPAYRSDNQVSESFFSKYKRLSKSCMSRWYASIPTLKVKAEISPAFYKDERKLMECCRYEAAIGTPGVR